MFGLKAQSVLIFLQKLGCLFHCSFAWSFSVPTLFWICLFVAISVSKFLLQFFCAHLSFSCITSVTDTTQLLESPALSSFSVTADGLLIKASNG